MFAKRYFFIVTVLFFLFGLNSSVFSQNTRITKSGYLASLSEDMLDKAIEYIAVKDSQALQKLMDSKLVFELKGGLEVYIVDTKLFRGKVKIRPVGHTAELWTLIEAVSK